MTAFHAGDEVRLPNGSLVILDEEPNPNPNYDADDETWCTGHYSGSEGINSLDIDDHEGIELVRSAAEMAKRVLPSLKELQGFLSSAIISGYGNGIEVTETDHVGDDSVEAYGSADNGLKLGFTVKIVQYDYAD